MPKKLNPNMTATDRTLRLYTKLLFSGERLFLADLAEQFGCSKSTVLKTMRVIEASGIAEITTDLEDNRRWFQLKNLPGTPYIGLTGDEVEKLALCRDMLERLLPEGIERIISDGIAKVSTLIRQAEKRGEAIMPKAARTSWGRVDYSAHQGLMEALLAAIPKHAVCAVRYREPEYRYSDREPKNYCFVPVRLVAEDESINAEGWLVSDSGKPEIMHPLTLAIQRIDSCRPTERSLPACPALPEHQGAFGLLGYEAFPVTVAFCEEFSGFIRERVWSAGQKIIDLPDGGVELHFRAADEDELMGWVFSFGNGAELIEPKSLRRKLFEEVCDLWDMYAEEDNQE